LRTRFDACQQPDLAGQPAATVLIEGPGTVIGAYKLLQQISEGGMGTVYIAQQTRPVQRMVALKIIKPGMDSRQVIARFEAERQALALMDHPNIARVLADGTTETGRPYFVIELVKGEPPVSNAYDAACDLSSCIAVVQKYALLTRHQRHKQPKAVVAIPGYAWGVTIVILCLASAAFGVAGILASRQRGQSIALGLAGLLLSGLDVIVWFVILLSWHTQAWSRL
jgi:hypothetical protein